ncbi:MAG: cytochrome C oxidase subunit IV [Chloroflexi bacterium]|nr:cytochrome C oxidase subunit IV [Chloroflexota bacterium]|tara:strand:- start:1325 stop:1633 length:309 start_codon:yes stop_codon:yes gene_type:complete
MANEHSQSESHSHPGPREYVIIGIILAVITAIEVGVFYLQLSTLMMSLILLGLSAAKFYLVIMYFMHLKFDDKRFLLLFVAPMIIMVSIMFVLLAVFLKFAN